MPATTLVSGSNGRLSGSMRAREGNVSRSFCIRIYL